MKEIYILGSLYTIEYRSIKKDKNLDTREGYTDLYKKQIIIANVEERDYFQNESKEKIVKVKNKILRHEIVHAFLYESGLDVNSNDVESWADNEEMVDWIAIQSPKILEVYKELGCLDEYKSKT